MADEHSRKEGRKEGRWIQRIAMVREGETVQNDWHSSQTMNSANDGTDLNDMRVPPVLAPVNLHSRTFTEFPPP
jgi:hypothetical protein